MAIVVEDAVHRYYEQGLEEDRLLKSPLGRLEFERSKEIVSRTLPPPPAVVADIGGGPGAYTLWLADLGYQVIHRDPVPLHVEQLRERADSTIDTAVGDARALEIDDSSVDAVLLFGPIYHLVEGQDRHRALAEARRIVRPGGLIYVAAISRWAARFHAVLQRRIYREHPGALDLLPEVEATGVLPPLRSDRDFPGYVHRPHQLRTELIDAGLDVESLVGVEGASFLMPDLDERSCDPLDWSVVLDSARATESAPELLGIGPHLLATCRPAP